MTLRNKKRFRAINYLDIAPLIDCVFLLLIFFLLTSSFIQQSGFEVNLPSAANAQSIDDANLALYVSSNGNIYSNSKKINFAELKGLFLSNKKPVTINADKDVRLETVTQIIDLARSCKIENISIATRDGYE